MALQESCPDGEGTWCTKYLGLLQVALGLEPLGEKEC